MNTSWAAHGKLILYFVKPHKERGFHSNSSHTTVIKQAIGNMRIFSFGAKRNSRRISKGQISEGRIAPQNQWYEFLVIGYNPMELRDLHQIHFHFQDTHLPVSDPAGKKILQTRVIEVAQGDCGFQSSIVRSELL